MAVDLSGPFKKRYERSLSLAREAEGKKDWKEAARHYREAAESLRRLAGALSSARARRARLEEADELENRAEELTLYGGASKSGGAPRPAAGRGAARTDEDGIRDAVRAMRKRADVKWSDIAGLEEVKSRIRTAYATALAVKPPNVETPSPGNILLYGPPGTGKTMLAAAVSGSLAAAFFSARLSDLLSKYFGESSRIVAELYREAERKAPSVVFLDDFEALVPPRTGDMNGPERRVLAEMLVALDGLERKGLSSFVLTIAATNAPWLVDGAVLSRFGLKIYVPLPDEEARAALFRLHLERKGYRATVPFREFAEAAAGYSGREIEQLCRIMIMEMMRRENPSIENLADEPEKLKGYVLKVRPLTPEDLESAKEQVRPSTDAEMLKKYDEWRRRFGVSG